MSKHVYFFGDGRADGDPMRRDLLGGKGRGPRRDDLARAPGARRASRSRPRRATRFRRRTSTSRGSTRRSRTRSRTSRRASGAKLGDPREPAARQRPLRRARVDARHDGHDPEPRPQRRDRRRRSRRARRTARFAIDAYRRFVVMYSSIVLGARQGAVRHALDDARVRVAKAKGVDASRINAEELKRAVPDSDLAEQELAGARRDVQEDRPRQDRQGFPERSEGAALGRDRGRLRVVEQRARRRTTARMHDIPDDWGTACNVQAMVFGNLGDDSATGVAFTRNPSTGEQQALRRVAAERARRGRRRGHPHADARSARSGTRDSLEEKMPRAFAQLVADRRDAREALPRHAGPRVHDPERAALHAAVPQRQAHRSRAAVRIAVEMVKRGAHRRSAKRVAPRRAGVARSAACTRRSIRTRRRSSSRAGSPRARARRAARSCSTPTRRRGAPAQGDAVDPRARRDDAGGHPRHAGGARHPHGARRHDEPRGGRRARHGQAVRRRVRRRCRFATTTRPRRSRSKAAAPTGA